MRAAFWGPLVLAISLSGAVAAEQPDGSAPVSARTPNRSLMFTPAEWSQIVAAIADAGKPHVAVQAPVPGEVAVRRFPNIYVSAIADFGPGHWTIWANGYRIAPGRQAPGFKVIGVADDLVEILVDADPPIRVTLRSNQTWRSEHNDVIEGIFP